MAGTFKFELVTPERMALSQDATQVLVPGFEGEFTVLPGHAPVISALRPGVIDAALADARKVRVFVKGGLAEIDADHAAAGDDAARLAAATAVERLKAMGR